MNISMLIFSFCVMLFIESCYIKYSCERQMIFSNKPASQLDLNACVSSYSSSGLSYLIDKAGCGIVYVVEQFSNQPFTMTFMILIGLFTYGAINRRSDVGQTTSDVFIAVRQDMSTVFTELWSTLKDAFMTFYRTITIAKIIEVFFIGFILSNIT